MILLLFGAPFVNAILLIGMYCYVYIYLNRLQVFVRNKQRVTDPFKNMVYDPQICHSLRRDHYFFEVEFAKIARKGAFYGLQPRFLVSL
jgi:hypothetical protein